MSNESRRVVQEFHGAVETAGPIQTGVNGDAIIDVLTILNGGLFDFVDGLIDLVNRFFFFVLQLTVIGTFEVSASSAKIGKSVQVSRMTALRSRIARSNRKKYSEQQSREHKFSNGLHQRDLSLMDLECAGEAALLYEKRDAFTSLRALT